MNIFLFAVAVSAIAIITWRIAEFVTDTLGLF